MSDWEELGMMRKFLTPMGLILWGAALILAAASAWDFSLFPYVAIVFLLGSLALTSAQAMARISKLEAALDMRRRHLEMAGVAQKTFHFNAGDELRLTGTHSVRFHTSTKVEVVRFPTSTKVEVVER